MARLMKNSGIQWIGDIPQDWKTTKLLNTLRNFISDGPHETPNLIDNGIPFISVDSLNDSENINFDIVKKFISKEDYLIYNKKTKLEYGDILFSKSATIGKTAIVKNDIFMVWSPLAIIKVNYNISYNKFIYYLLNCEQLIKYISLLGSVNTQVNVGMRTLEKAIIPLPPLEEQQRIANYLDEKCSKIDETIEKEKAIIEKLKEYKQSLITETVTKGLNPNVPLKDSGIDWIGSIPQHWETKQLSQLFKQHKCKNKENIENNVLSLSYGNIKRKDVSNNMGLLPENFETYNIIHNGNIVLRLTDLQNDHKSLRVGLAKETGIITSAYVTLENTYNINNSYYYRLLHTFDIKKGFYGMGDGVRQSLKFDELKKLLLIMPPIKEQEEISKYLDEKCNAIDNAINQRETLIDKLTEYKKSLIYECVTGKKEV